MSRIGLKPVPLPHGVTLSVGADHADVKGPKGAVSVPVPVGITVTVDGEAARVARKNDTKPQKALHGLTRALLANAVRGDTEGYQQVMQVVGTGYKAEMGGGGLSLSLGFSHPILFPLPAGVSARVEDRNTTIILNAIDKQLLGQVTADLRRLRPPDAYKGKGIRRQDERISLKPGKTAGK